MFENLLCYDIDIKFFVFQLQFPNLQNNSTSRDGMLFRNYFTAKFKNPQERKLTVIGKGGGSGGNFVKMSAVKIQ